jgi:hypothetical protein
MSKYVETAKKIRATADSLGWRVSVRGTILTITKKISGIDEFVKADMEYYSILGLLPSTSPGSIWGTDGGGVGAWSAMNTGMFKMNKSGGSKRVLTALSKI